MSNKDLVVIPMQSIDDLLTCIATLCECCNMPDSEEKNNKIKYATKLSNSALKTYQLHLEQSKTNNSNE